MSISKMLTIFTIGILAGVLFFCNDNILTESDNLPSVLTRKGLYGKLVDRDGIAVYGVKVMAIKTVSSLNITRSANILNGSDFDSSTTDSSGYYSFESLTNGMHNIQGDYDNSKLVVLITNVNYDSTVTNKEIRTDTLRVPGQITGQVNTQTDDHGSVFCYIPGTSYLAITDDTGSFVLSDIPQGIYKVIYRRDGLKTVCDTSIEVHSGKKTMLPVKEMKADTDYPPPAPTGLEIAYDTLHGCARLNWNPVTVSDLAGYIIYRNDMSFSTPQQLNKLIETDTFYIDTIFTDLMDTTDKVFIYRLKAQDKNANVSTVFSRQRSIDAVSPTKVRTFFTWKYINTVADSASISDTVSVIVTYMNCTRKNMKLKWYINSTDSVFSTKNDSLLTGMDTITCVWLSASTQKIYVTMLDQANTVWQDSTSIKVVLDVPVANAGSDTGVFINTDVPFMGIAAQTFGTIQMYKWDFDGDGAYDDSSTSTGTISHTYTHEAIYNAKLLVRDDDGNEAVDIRVITVTNKAPVITSIRPDTTISIHDSVPFHATVTNNNGSINEYAWDFNGDGTFEYRSNTRINAGYKYDTAGTYSAVFKLRDNDNKITLDTVSVEVLQDTPVPNAGVDTTVHLDSTVSFHGTYTQQFGTIVMQKWDFDGDSVFDDSSAADFIPKHRYMLKGVYDAVFLVRDDDGNEAVASKKVYVDLPVPAIDGFVVWSKGGGCERELYYNKIKVNADGKNNTVSPPKLVVPKGPGADIWPHISYDGQWIAWCRAPKAFKYKYGACDYHNFALWDIYVARIEFGKILPVLPIKVADGFWPSWAMDENARTPNKSKSLYFTHYETQTIKKVIINPDGTFTKPVEHSKFSQSMDTNAHIQISPDGKFLLYRPGGKMKVHSLELKKDICGSLGGYHPCWGPRSKYFIISMNRAFFNTGISVRKLGSAGVGSTFQGISNDAHWDKGKLWVIGRIGGSGQNGAGSVEFREVGISNDGDWILGPPTKIGIGGSCDIHMF